MNEMTERVARAIADQLNPADKNFPAPTWAAQAARRAIAAMREPTEAMVVVAEDVPCMYGIGDDGGGEHLCADGEAVWHAMIDAALEQQEG